MGSGNYNRIGIQARYAVLDIETSDFEIAGDTGFMAGLTTRGRLYNNFGMIYWIDFVSLSTNVQGRALGNVSFEDMQYTVIGAQLNLLLSYNILEQNLAIEAGPALMVNSKMTLKNQGQEDNIVKGYASLKATDIEEISRINPFVVVALTGGFERIRFTVQYQYGFTNILGNLNSQDLQDVDRTVPDFKGSSSIISGGIVLYL
jgi:hypothetical protein